MYEPSISVDNVIDAMGTLLETLFPDAEITRAQVNRVPMPGSPCIVLTEILQSDLSIPYQTYQPDLDTAKINGPARIDVQVDFYGASASEYCKTFVTVFRSTWGIDQFPANIKPLYTNDGMQSPLITGEQQWESRWTLTASLQYNPTITVTQEFADEAIPVINIPVDLI